MPTTSRAGAIFSACLRAHADGARASDLPPDTDLWEAVTGLLIAYVDDEEATTITFLTNEDVRLVLLLLLQFSDLEVE